MELQAIGKTDRLFLKRYEEDQRMKFRNGQIIDVSFMQDAGIGPWVYAGGVDAITGKYINGYIHEDYYG